jgi:hypothetical protein
MNVSISICPTELEFASGDHYDERKLLAAIREFVEQRHPEATITCLQVGPRQGDGWWRIDGDDEAGAALMDEFWTGRAADERLFVSP